MLIVWLILGSRGGFTRMRILKSLRESPCNAHSLAKRLGLNYRTVKYHLDLMVKHGLVEKVGDGYGAVYVLSKEVEESWDEIEKMVR